jgi:hypothetical protein
VGAARRKIAGTVQNAKKINEGGFDNDSPNGGREKRAVG